MHFDFSQGRALELYAKAEGLFGIAVKRPFAMFDRRDM
jgi:hypothetical protein